MRVFGDPADHQHRAHKKAGIGQIGAGITAPMSRFTDTVNGIAQEVVEE